jgi:hypothetical protein
MEREKKLTPVPVRCAPLALAAAACLRADRSEPAGAAARAAAPAAAATAASLRSARPSDALLRVSTGAPGLTLLVLVLVLGNDNAAALAAPVNSS